MITNMTNLPFIRFDKNFRKRSKSVAKIAIDLTNEEAQQLIDMLALSPLKDTSSTDSVLKKLLAAVQK